MTDTLLPPNATEFEIAIADIVSRISDIPVPNASLYTPDECPEDVLPWLAWAFSVDEWNPDWTQEQKRAAAANSAYVHRHKGTVGAMKKALAALGYEITLEEWHQLVPKGDPYTFGINLEVHDIGIESLAEYDRIIAVANGAKNVRSHMTFLNINSTRTGTVYIGGASFCGDVVTLNSGD